MVNKLLDTSSSPSFIQTKTLWLGLPRGFPKLFTTHLQIKIGVLDETYETFQIHMYFDMFSTPGIFLAASQIFRDSNPMIIGDKITKRLD